MPVRIDRDTPDDPSVVGNLTAASAMDHSTGIPLIADDGQRFALLRGSPGPDDSFAGTSPTVHLSGGADDGDPNRVSTETIDGMDAPFDAVVIPGRQADYIARLPQIGEYPTRTSSVWENQDSLFGSGVVLTHAETGDQIRLAGVDRVVFDHDDAASGNPVKYMNGLGESIQNGRATSVSMQELFATAKNDLSPSELNDARIAASREAADYTGKHINIFKGNVDQQLADAMTDLREANIPSLETRAYEPPQEDPVLQRSMERVLGLTPPQGPS